MIMTYQVRYNATVPRPFRVINGSFAHTVNIIKVMVMETISSSGEPIDAVVLNIHIVRLPSKYVCLHRCVPLSTLVRETSCSSG